MSLVDVWARDEPAKGKRASSMTCVKCSKTETDKKILLRACVFGKSHGLPSLSGPGHVSQEFTDVEKECSAQREASFASELLTNCVSSISSDGRWQRTMPSYAPAVPQFQWVARLN